MKKIWFLAMVLVTGLLALPLAAQIHRILEPVAPSGKSVSDIAGGWRVLDPITRGNLSIYPVISGQQIDTRDFLTLDEGIASGQVRVLERGQYGSAMYRPRAERIRPWQEMPPQGSSPSVNELVLVNESSRPLILLAGEVVSGGKQNRIIGADLVVPPKSPPLPLSVFCVEHGRWSSGSQFSAASAIAHPEIRREAQVAKSQSGVWDSVAGTAGALRAVSPTSSYLDVLNSPQAKPALEKEARAIESDYERELRDKIGHSRSVGVVVAINGELVWSDVFASPDLFQRYWPKLLRSYVLEAQTHDGGAKGLPSARQAFWFLNETAGRTTIQEEPGAYRRTQISGRGFEAVVLEALGVSKDSALMVHYNKMANN